MKFFHIRRSTIWKFIFSIIAFVAFIALILQLAFQRGAVTKEDVVTQYILAIHEERPEQIVRLMPSSHNISQSELDKLIENSGGKTLDVTQISYIPSESPQIDIVRLAGVYKRNEEPFEFTDTLYIRQINNRWYLILGRDKNGPPITAPDSKID